MTEPLPHGYPDWGRYQAGADKILQQVASFTVAAAQDFGPYFVGDVTHVRFRVSSSANNLECVVNFYEDAALSRLIATETFDVRAATTFNSSLPAHGPYAQMTVTPVGGNCSCIIGVFTAHVAWRPIGTIPLNNVLFAARAISHPVGNTTLSGGGVIPGEAWFNGHATVALTQMDLNAIRADGTVIPLCSIKNADGNVTRHVNLPPLPIQLIIVNGSAGAQLFDYSLTCTYGNLG